jgi:hypothetical protein
MRWGIEHEKDALYNFLAIFDVHVEWFNVGLVLCDFDPLLSCSPDGIVKDPVTGKLWIVEFKCPFSMIPYKEIPNHHQAQLLGTMAITKIPRFLYVVWAPGMPLKIFAGKFNQAKWDRLYYGVKSFLRCVQKGEEPSRAPRGTKMVLGLDWTLDLKKYFPSLPNDVNSYYTNV